MRLSLLAAAVCSAVLASGCSGGDPPSAANPSMGSGTDTSSTSAAPPTDAPSAASAAAFDMVGAGCNELLLIIQMTEAEARQVVPQAYVLLGAAGQAAGFIALKECADLTIDGVSVGNASTS